MSDEVATLIYVIALMALYALGFFFHDPNDGDKKKCEKFEKEWLKKRRAEEQEKKEGGE